MKRLILVWLLFLAMPAWAQQSGAAASGATMRATTATAGQACPKKGEIRGNGTTALWCPFSGSQVWTALGGGGGGAVSSITGTANQVIASASTGAVTLSLPQSIATTSAVQFGTVNVVKESGGSVPTVFVRGYTDYPRMQFIQSGGTIASPTQTLSGAYLMRLYVGGTDNTGAISNGSRASWIVTAAQNFTSSAQGTAQIFSTTPNGSLTEQPRLTLENDGKVKIHALSGSGSRVLFADTNNYVEAQTVATARTTLGLGTADSVQFGTLALTKEWGSSATSNLMFDIKSYGDPSRLIFTHAGGTVASPTQTGSGQNIFNIQARGTDNAGTASNGSRAGINMVANEAFTASAQGTYMLFNTTSNGSASQSPRLKIEHDGRLLVHGLAGGGSRIVNVDNDGYLGAQSSATTPRTYSGAYSLFPKNTSADASGAYTANTVYYYKTSEPDAITINRIGTYLYTGSAGATLDIGFYNSDCTTKLISTGATDLTTGSSSLAVTVTSTTISGGLCVMWTTSSATPTFQQLTWGANAWRFANGNGATSILGTCSNTASGGVLPASCGTLTSSNTLAPLAVRAWVN